MTTPRLVRPPDVKTFLAVAGAFLTAREAEHNLMLGICTDLPARAYGREPPYFAAVESGGRVVAAALRTPPFNVVISAVDDPHALVLFADDVLREYPDVPGVLGEKTVARAFADLWQARTGRTARLRMEERIFRCSGVIPARPVGGHLREAAAEDREVIATWLAAFALEALGDRPDAEQARTMADRWLEARERRLFLWDDGGPVSLVGVSGRTPNGIRVAPVYTPPELRGRGYASACVAAVTHAQLAAGRKFCFLFTDLANPTSNKIYRDIGYEAVCDVDEYRFEPRPSD